MLWPCVPRYQTNTPLVSRSLNPLGYKTFKTHAHNPLGWSCKVVLSWWRQFCTNGAPTWIDANLNCHASWTPHVMHFLYFLHSLSLSTYMSLPQLASQSLFRVSSVFFARLHFRATMWMPTGPPWYFGGSSTPVLKFQELELWYHSWESWANSFFFHEIKSPMHMFSKRKEKRTQYITH